MSMITQIVSYLLDVAAGLLAGAGPFGLYMQVQRVPFGNPVGRFVFALTNWLVLPLRRILPSRGRWDFASVVGAFLIELLHYAVLWLLNGATGFGIVPLMAIFGLLRLV